MPKFSLRMLVVWTFVVMIAFAMNTTEGVPFSHGLIASVDLGYGWPFEYRVDLYYGMRIQYRYLVANIVICLVIATTVAWSVDSVLRKTFRRGGRPRVRD